MLAFQERDGKLKSDVEDSLYLEVKVIVAK